jgi:uncharacterized protein with beta-barrel porin domain
MIFKQSHVTEETRRHTALRLWLKFSAQILAAGLCVTVMTNSALACSSGPPITTSVPAVDGTAICDLSITNTGIVNSIGGWAVSYFSGSNNTLNNAGDIRGGTYGVFIVNGAITSLNNTSTISSDPTGIGIFIGSGTITTLSNTGTISAPTGVYNNGTITTLNNKQGAGNVSGALTYAGVLPTNYNIIIADAGIYGQLSMGSVSGRMAFGVSSPATTSSLIVGFLLPGVLVLPSVNTLALSSYVSGLTLVAPNTYTYSSANYSYSLTPTTGSSVSWDLRLTACSVCGSGDSGGNTGSGSGNAPKIINFTGSDVLINGGTITIGAPGMWAGGSITVGPSGATMVMTGNPIYFPGNVTLNGPLTIVGGDGMFSFSKQMTGSGGLILGNGTSNTSFFISGANNTRTGPTYVTPGARLFAGVGSAGWWGNPEGYPLTPLGSGDIFVEGAAYLSGAFPGNVAVKGSGSTLHTGGSPGYASYGSLTMGAGSTYLQDIAGKVQSDATTIMGTAGTYSFADITTGLVIESGTTLTTRLSDLFSADEPGYGSSTYIPVLGDRFRIFTAAGGITGRFTTLTQPAELSSGTQLIAFYNVNNSNSLDLAIAPTSYISTLSSSTPNAKSVAGVLDQLLGVNKAGTASAAQDSLLYAVAGQKAASLPGFARSLAGEIHAASAATLSQTTQRVQQSVLARLGDYPMAPSQLNPALNNALLTGGISATNTSGLPTASMSTNPAVNPNAVNVTSAAVKDGRAWGEIAYQRSERASNSGGNGFNSNLYQIVTGVDAYSNAELGLKLGGGLALSNTTVSANGGNSTIQQGSLFVYGKMPILQDYVLDGMASVGMSSTNLSRNDPTGYTGGFSSKAVLGNDALVSVGLSRAFEYNDVRVTPYARLTYQYVGQNSYDEGSGAAALNIARFSGSALRGVIGVAAGSLNKDPLKDEYTYRVNVAVGADTSASLNPTLNTTLGGYSSTVTTATAGSAFVQVGLYGTVKISDNAYAYAGVSGEARSGQTLYGGSVGLRVAF